MNVARQIPALFRGAIRPFQQFAQLESAGGVLLLVSAVAALLWANLHPESYQGVFAYPLTLGVGDATATFPLRTAINDGLMAIFFFVVGMEIKRELVLGELNTPAKASLPLIAAAGGMVFPALIFWAFTGGGPEAAGWAIPMATDIAFCLGIVTLLKGRVPRSLVVFLTALAIFDDVGGILVIAFFYAGGLHTPYLAAAAALCVVLVLMGRFRVTSGLAYAAVGIALWYAIHHAGIHATIAGVVLGLSIPARQRTAPRAVLLALSDHVSDLLRSAPDEDLDHAQIKQVEEDLEDLTTPVQRFTHALHPLVTFGVMPVFALANSGIPLAGLGLSSFASPVAAGVAVGLVVGKPLGIAGLTWLAVRSGRVPLPEGSNWRQLAGVAVIAGIGFTVALFIAGLAYPGALALLDQAKLGIITGSFVAGVVGLLILRLQPVLSDAHASPRGR